MNIDDVRYWMVVDHLDKRYLVVGWDPFTERLELSDGKTRIMIQAKECEPVKATKDQS